VKKGRKSEQMVEDWSCTSSTEMAKAWERLKTLRFCLFKGGGPGNVQENVTTGGGRICTGRDVGGRKIKRKNKNEMKPNDVRNCREKRSRNGRGKNACCFGIRKAVARVSYRLMHDVDSDRA